MRPYNGCTVTLGLYISVPFCKTKCSYCNFASDVFSKSAFENYVARVIEDIGRAHETASELGCFLDATVDSIYLGGGTPSILDGAQLLRIFQAVRQQFAVANDAEITVECAPGTLTSGLIETLRQCGVNRVSLGVQSFVDREAQAVGRLHKCSTVHEEVARLRSAGIDAINIDLIAGLPYQTAESWSFSLAETVALGAPHASVYMLEVDEDSRLGRELIAGGTRYHAHFVPDDGATADFYEQACKTLNAAGIAQYEISNFARAGAESRHNLKYWTRQPYIGFGVDAHSMLPMPGLPGPGPRELGMTSAESGERSEAIRLATPDSLDAYMNRVPHTPAQVSTHAAIEESFFLGLRLNRGVDLEQLRTEFSAEAVAAFEPAIEDCERDGLLEKKDTAVRLTSRGRLLSNEVFARFLGLESSEENRSGDLQARDKTKVGTGHVNPR